MSEPFEPPKTAEISLSLAALELHHRQLAEAHAFITQKLQRWMAGHLSKAEVLMIFRHQANATHHPDAIRSLYHETVTLVEGVPDA